MSFKDDAHSELLGVLPVSHDEIIAFLSALSKACGSIEIVKKRLNLCLQLDSYEEGVKIVDLFKQIYPADFDSDAWRFWHRRCLPEHADNSQRGRRRDSYSNRTERKRAY